MDRRDLLRAFGAAAALTLLPRDAQAAWTRVARSPGAPLRALSAAEGAQIGALADVILPRTDSPGATDVGVVAWVDLVVADYYRDEERKQFLEGLAAIDALAQGATAGAGAYAPSNAAKLIESLESGDRKEPAHRAWWRLKGLIVHGYFTSEPVQMKVLKVNITPGRFDGCAPVKAAPAKPAKTAKLGAHDHG